MNTLELVLSKEQMAELAALVATKVNTRIEDNMRVFDMGELADRLGIARRTTYYIRTAFPEYFIRIGHSYAITAKRLTQMLQDMDDGIISLESITVTAQSGTSR